MKVEGWRERSLTFGLGCATKTPRSAGPDTPTTITPTLYRTTMTLMNRLQVYHQILLPCVFISVLFNGILLLTKVKVTIEGVDPYKSATTTASSLASSIVPLEAASRSIRPTGPPLQAPATRPFTVCATTDGATVTLPPVPSFIIAGAQKAGTTALYHMLSHHPQIQSSRRLETHFFDYHIQGCRCKNASLLSDADICDARLRYLTEFNVDSLLDHPDQVAFEKTPSYLCYPQVPALLRRTVPWVKIVVVLRNPIDRAYSAYKMEAGSSRKYQEKSFELKLDKEISRMLHQGVSIAPPLALYPYIPEDRAFGIPQDLTYEQRMKVKLLYASLLYRGMYAQQLVYWLREFPLHHSLKIIRYEEFVQNKARILGEILDFVGAPPLQLPPELLEDSYSPRHGRGSDLPPMSNLTRQYLQEFYQPYNDELADLLGEEWRGVWDE